MLWSAWLACAHEEPKKAFICPCQQVSLPQGPITTEPALQALLADALPIVAPSLVGVSVGVEPIDDLAYLRAWTELDTVSLDDGTTRQYTVHYDPLLLREPPTPNALLAALTHELGHISDYVEMDSDELIEFALWYGTQDPMTSDGLRDYERETDEVSLANGCADGLSDFRLWIAERATPEILAEKTRNYYTPEEIASWTDSNGACTTETRSD